MRLGCAWVLVAACDEPRVVRWPTDRDRDGWAANVDCDDRSPRVHPLAPETWYDGIDQDCDGWSDDDADRDGYDAIEEGGPDCDDTDPEITGADLDRDGLSGCLGDCNDLRADVGPGADPVCGDGVDNDCNGTGECPFSGVLDVTAIQAGQIRGDPARPGTGTWLYVANLDGDAWPDLVSAVSQKTWVLQGPIVPDVAVTDAAMATFPGVLYPVDLDGDGIHVLTGAPLAGYDGTRMVFGMPFAAELDEGNASFVLDPLSEGAVATGDFDGDGVVDLAIGGSDAQDPGPQGEDLTWGVAQIHLGPITGPVDSADATLLLGEVGETYWGFNVSVDQDLSGDGQADLLAADLGGSSWLLTNPHLAGSVLDADVRWDDRVDEIHGVGDVDGDGSRDLLARTGDRAVDVFRGPIGPGTDLATPDIVIETAEVTGLHTTFALGDFDLDGSDDLCVTSPYRWGRVWILLGPYAPHVEVEGLAWATLVSGDHLDEYNFGMSCAAADLDQDGLAEILVGEPGVEGYWGSLEGTVWVVQGGGAL